jgi:hypothetical protein
MFLTTDLIIVEKKCFSSLFRLYPSHCPFFFPYLSRRTPSSSSSSEKPPFSFLGSRGSPSPQYEGDHGRWWPDLSCMARTPVSHRATSSVSPLLLFLVSFFLCSDSISHCGIFCCLIQVGLARVLGLRLWCFSLFSSL